MSQTLLGIEITRKFYVVEITLFSWEKTLSFLCEKIKTKFCPLSPSSIFCYRRYVLASLDMFGAPNVTLKRGREEDYGVYERVSYPIPD